MDASKIALQHFGIHPKTPKVSLRCGLTSTCPHCTPMGCGVDLDVNRDAQPDARNVNQTHRLNHALAPQRAAYSTALSRSDATPK